MTSVSLHDFVMVQSERANGKGLARVAKLYGSGSGQEADIVYDDGTEQRLYV